MVTDQAAWQQVNSSLIVPFVHSVRNVFGMMVKVPTTFERPCLKHDAAATYDVSSIIGFSGNVKGTVVLSLQMTAATKLVEAFAGAAVDPDGPDFADAVGELANIIAGAAKQHLGGSASITVPTVVIGHGHKIARLTDVPCVLIPCKTPVGDYCIEISIKRVD